MQNFTVFSVLLSFSIVFIVGDLVIHDYFKSGALIDKSGSSVSQAVQDSAGDANTIIDTNDRFTGQSASAGKNLIDENAFIKIGFENPLLKDVDFNGTVFQNIEFSDQIDAQITQKNVFDGENFIATVYEARYPSATGSFQAYLNLRDRALELSSIGAVEEVNMYGEANFYFNHKEKTKTVHMVMRSGSNVFAFEYPYAKHEKMKKLFDLFMFPL